MRSLIQLCGKMRLWAFRRMGVFTVFFVCNVLCHRSVIRYSLVWILDAHQLQSWPTSSGPVVAFSQRRSVMMWVQSSEAQPVLQQHRIPLYRSLNFWYLCSTGLYVVEPKSHVCVCLCVCLSVLVLCFHLALYQIVNTIMLILYWLNYIYVL